MKLILMIFISLISFNLFANCEHLTGNYVCHAGSRVMSKDLEVSTTELLMKSDGIEGLYYLDGISYDVPATNNTKDGKVTTLCENGKLVMNFTTTLLYEGSEIAKQVQRTEYFKSGDGMGILIKTKAKGIPLPKIKFECKRT